MLISAARRRLLAASFVALATLNASVSFAASSKVTVEDDRFSANATLMGPPIAIKPPGETYRTWRIRSFVGKKTGRVTHQLYVQISYAGEGWRFYEIAADDAATPLAVTKIASSVEDCSQGICTYSETVGVDLDDGVLKSRIGNTYDLKFSAKSGDSFILSVSSDQISQQMDAIEAEKAVLAGLPPPAPKEEPVVPLAPQGPGATAAIAQPSEAMLAVARKVLVSQGYTLAAVADPNTVATLPLAHKLTTRQADCGKKFGIPYLWDGRAKTQVSFTLTAADGRLAVRAGMGGIFKVAVGVDDLPLTCTPTGALEAEELSTIQAALPRP
jgi:hypothetical protein